MPKFLNAGNGNASYEELTSNMKPYDDMDIKIRIYVPDDYEMTSNQYNTYYHKNEESMIYLTHDDSKNDLENLSLNVQADYAKETDNFDLKKNSKVSQNGVDLCVMEYDYEIETTDVTYKKSGMTIICVANGEAYFVTCATDQDKYEQYRDDYVRTYKTILPRLSNDSKKA